MGLSTFSLASPALVWGLRLLLLLAVSWIVLRWAKAADPGIWSYLRRLLSVVVLIVLGTLNVIAPVNAQYGWYDTVGDLLSTVRDPVVLPPQTHRGSPASQSSQAQVGPQPFATMSTAGRASTKLHLKPTASGGYQEFTVPGPVSGYTGKVTVWFPPSYQDPAARNRQYPVLETYHGYLPSPLAYFSVFHIDSVIAQNVAAHKMREPVVLIPHWGPNRLDTECVNGGPGHIQMEDWLTRDVPAWAYTHLRVAAGRQSWATLGASAGGWCALMSTMLHPSTYSAAISLGGYAKPEFDPSYVPFTPGSLSGRRYDLVQLARTQPPAVALWVLSSVPDKLANPQSTALTAATRPPASVTATVLPTGGHRSEVWTPYFPSALAWLGSNASGFAPL
ncbi:alpha/beta hydrolase [Gephyromycinifex aptenodytis]|uniref:alpha/beta hydrolase n=1 Tax=Gephyromycinifex aptenodytis TaxID=2716227 RepID=UPI001445D04A|nr:alpha/beta hydrolase-fold protein [Gephyromycinifex aptenodytis]